MSIASCRASCPTEASSPTMARSVWDLPAPAAPRTRAGGRADSPRAVRGDDDLAQRVEGQIGVDEAPGGVFLCSPHAQIISPRRGG